MQEVDAICDRALIMRSGRLVVDAKLEDLRRSKNLLLHTDLGDEKFFSKMSSIEKVSPLSTDSGHLYQLILYPDFDAADVAAEVARNLIESGFSIYELKREQRDLEAVFREVNEMPLPEKEEAEVSHAA
jgi:ABC-2 type transport system ATP-binding protein